ncbi:MAG TPA: hypothetical protein VF282_00365 [Bacillota bacterium]
MSTGNRRRAALVSWCLAAVLMVMAACGGGATSGGAPAGGSTDGAAAGPADSAAAGPAGGDGASPAEGGASPAGGAGSADGSGSGAITSAELGENGETLKFEGTTGGGQGFAGTAGTDVPEDFPLPVYPEWTVMMGARAETDGAVHWNVAAQYEGDAAELSERYAQELEGLGLSTELVEMGSDLYGISFSGTLEGRALEGEVSIAVAGGNRIINLQVRAPEG